MVTAKRNKAEPIIKTMVMMKATPSKPMTRNGCGLGGWGGGTGQLASQSTQLQAGVFS